MKELATVKKINGEIVHVAIAMHDGCASCINGKCKTGRSDIQVHNTRGFDIEEGDRVEIEIPGVEQAKSAFWVLGLPLAALFVGYGGGRLAFPSTSETPAVISAGALFALTLLAGIVVQKARKQDALPTITKKCET